MYVCMYVCIYMYIYITRRASVFQQLAAESGEAHRRGRVNPINLSMSLSIYIYRER